MSIAFVSLIMFRLIDLLIQMQSGSNDNIYQVDTTNDFHEETRRIDVIKSNFMPYFEMVRHTNDYPDETFDIFKVDPVTGKKTFDADKLSNYMEPMIHIRIRKQIEDSDLNWFKRMRNCKLSDFADKGYEVSENQKSLISGYICPDYGKDYENLVIENEYSDKTLRKSFSLEMTECVPELNTNCKSPEDIKKLLHTYYFNFYTLVMNVDLSP